LKSSRASRAIGARHAATSVEDMEARSRSVDRPTDIHALGIQAADYASRPSFVVGELPIGAIQRSVKQAIVDGQSLSTNEPDSRRTVWLSEALTHWIERLDCRDSVTAINTHDVRYSFVAKRFGVSTTGVVRASSRTHTLAKPSL
jgi:hypothetical protein